MGKSFLPASSLRGHWYPPLSARLPCSHHLPGAPLPGAEFPRPFHRQGAEANAARAGPIGSSTVLEVARPTLCQGNKGFLLPGPPLSRLARPGPLAPAGHLKSDCPWRGGCWLPSGCVGLHLVRARGLFASVANGLWCEDRDTPLSELEKGWWEAVQAAAGGFYGMGRAGSQSLGSWGLPCRHGLLGPSPGRE